MGVEFKTIQEIVLKAHRNMTPHVRDHVNGGSESETTLLRNRRSIDSLAFRPRVLRDVTALDLSSTFIGKKLPIPVFLAPVGGLNQFHPEGALHAARAAAGFGIPMFLSSVNPLDLQKAVEEAGDNLVFQLYQQGDKDWLFAYLERINKAGCRAFCLTVDTSYYSRRERDLFNRYVPPGRESGERPGFNYQATLTWDLVDKIRDRLEIPLILKGIGTAEDARLAVEHGVEVVYVSNHGGRQLDHDRGSMEALPEVVEAVAGKAEVVVDGGFVRGTDMLKALALGACAVGVGKLQAWALAAGGEAAVRRVLEILETEMSVNMGLLGVTKLDQLDASYVQKIDPVKAPHLWSPFPTLEKLLGS
jgi:isopentenyl diphosphate isomerase/L-lactate dehydrogenase-like FMN-dependent dehydrogenase